MKHSITRWKDGAPELTYKEVRFTNTSPRRGSTEMRRLALLVPATSLHSPPRPVAPPTLSLPKRSLGRRRRPLLRAASGSGSGDRRRRAGRDERRRRLRAPPSRLHVRPGAERRRAADRHGASCDRHDDVYGVLPLSESVGSRRPKIRPWIKIEDFDAEARLDNLIFPFPFIEPGTILNAFELVSGSVESLGEETVRGVSTDHYRLTLDLARLIETAPAADRAALREELEKTEGEDRACRDLDRRCRTRTQGSGHSR